MSDEALPRIERYVLAEEIARGAMGIIYRATDTVLNRDVAVKMLQEKYAPTSVAARRFVDETQITGRLQHPGIPAVHDLGTLPDGRPFLVMKLIEGHTLADLVAVPRRRRQELIGIFEPLCQAVAYAHSHGVIHRDLKPANVMVGAFGEVQVMDWGLAKVIRNADFGTRNEDPDATAELSSNPHSEFRIPNSDRTHAGSIIGTPAFMPPEQAIGAIDQIDQRSDVFGLGALLAVILTGQPPFVGETSEITRQLAARGKVDECFLRLALCGADLELVALCRRCLNPEKGKRPADAGAVATAVAELRQAGEERTRKAEVDLATKKAEASSRKKLQKAQWGTIAAFGTLAMLFGFDANTQRSARYAAESKVAHQARELNSLRNPPRTPPPKSPTTTTRSRLPVAPMPRELKRVFATPKDGEAPVAPPPREVKR